MRLSRICDAGHHVVFLKDSGYIEHGWTGHRTEFAHEDNVYLLKVHCEKRFSRTVAMNSESAKDEDVSPSSSFIENEMCLRVCGQMNKDVVNDAQNLQIERHHALRDPPS